MRKPGGELQICHGARAAEARVLEQIQELLDAPFRPEDLARPVRVIVPSTSLRRHLAARLLARRGRSVLGLSIHTLHGAALEILGAAAVAPPRGALVFDVLVRRFAREQQGLAGNLEALVDGYDAVSASVRDLLDAGYEEALRPALEEAMLAEGTRLGGRTAAQRGGELLAVTSATRRALELLAAGRHGDVLRTATELLAASESEAGEGGGAFPCRALLVHGFADATGLATDFLQALLRAALGQGAGTAVILDQPPDPSGGAYESSYPERLQERLSQGLGEAPRAAQRSLLDSPSTQQAPSLQAFEAPGAEAEVAEVARRLREVFDRQPELTPETVAVVARDLSPYRPWLARHFEARGLPYSAPGTLGGRNPAGRKAGLISEILRKGSETPTGRWLDARELAPTERIELRLAFHSLGAGRLGAVATLRPESFLHHGRLPLPIRGQDEGDDSELGAEPPESSAGAFARRSLPAERVREAIAAATRTRSQLDGWPEDAPAEVHGRRLESLLDELGWNEGSGLEVRQAAAQALAQVPSQLELSRVELQLMLGRALQDFGRAALGGRGGGVQILSATEARGLTFDHLYLLGLNRDVFPRPVREDPLLRDDLRRALLKVLPDLPIKRRGFDEERYLFAQLLSASPQVTLARQSQGEDGEARAPSPLLERLARSPIPGADTVQSPEPATSRFRAPVDATDAEGPRPALELAVAAGLHGGRRAMARALPIVVKGSAGAERRTPALLKILDELDPDLGTPEGRRRRQSFGPYLGFLGAEAESAGNEHFLTPLERFAGCPWQTLLLRRLRLEPAPDPLEALPGVGPLMVGLLVHRVLEAIPLDAGIPRSDARPGTSLQELQRRSPVPVSWPSAQDFERLIMHHARGVLEDQGVGLPGLASALAARARPFLEAARDQDWAEGPVETLASEADIRLGPIRFRADRVDAWGDSSGSRGLRLTDFKTGRPISAGKRPDTRRRHLLHSIATGEKLQAAAYALAARQALGTDTTPAEGRYLFLKPDLDPELRNQGVEGGDEEVAAAFNHATRAILAGWQAGTFFPRLVDPEGRKEPARCSYCEVAEACLRNDSGARRRLVEAADRARRNPASQDLDPGTARAFTDAWDLATGKVSDGTPPSG